MQIANVRLVSPCNPEWRSNADVTAGENVKESDGAASRSLAAHIYTLSGTASILGINLCPSPHAQATISCVRNAL
jgi:hypothetical protein